MYTQIQCAYSRRCVQSLPILPSGAAFNFFVDYLFVKQKSYIRIQISDSWFGPKAKKLHGQPKSLFARIVKVRNLDCQVVGLRLSRS